MSKTPDIDIRPDHWEIVRAILQEHVPQYEVWVFGSRAKWTAKEFSDLDLAIMTDEPLPKEISAALTDAFDESDLPYKVDVVDWAETNDDFQKTIRENSVVLRDFDSLIDIATFASGGTPSKTAPDYWSGSIPWLTPKDMPDFNGHTADTVSESAIGNGTRLAPADSIFIAVRGMSLHNEIRVAKSSKPIAFNQDIKAIIPKNIDSDFLYYAIVSQSSQLVGFVESAGHGTGRLPSDRLASLLIPRYTADEEKAIGRFFRAIDDKIELNRRMNETLESMARAIFKDWFVDSELTSIGNYAKLSTESWKMSHSGTINYVDLSGVKWGKILDVKQMDFDEAPSRARKILKSGDCIIGTVRPGNGSYAFVKEEGLTGSTGFAVIRPKRPDVAEFVYCAATSKDNIERLSLLADGGAYPAVSPAQIISSSAPKADSQVLHDFHKHVEPLFTKISLLQKESQTLAQLRDTLLPKLISGELRIKNAEKFVAEVV